MRPVRLYGRILAIHQPGGKGAQYYAEHHRPDVAAFPGGRIGLRRWFGTLRQMQLFQPSEYVVIHGSCVLSYETGFEQAKRQPHMKDWYSDAYSVGRHERRRRGALVETHIKDYFKKTYPFFYRPPQNEGKYDEPAKEDFVLDLGGSKVSVDVKSWTEDRGYIRKPQPGTFYVFADWRDDDTTIINGVTGAAWIRAIGEANDELYHIQRNHVSSIDCLLVYLNMTSMGLDYVGFKRHLMQTEVKVGAA